MLRAKSYIGLTMMLAAIVAAPAQAYIDNFLPAGLVGKLVPFKQEIVIKDIVADMNVTIDGVQFLNTPEEFFVKGTNKSGKSWSTKTESIGLGGAIFKADLDGNGQSDLLITASTAACGIAPPTRLLTILFDSRGNPHPFETVGYFDADKMVEDYVRVPGNPRAVLLQHELTYVKGVTRDRNYWRWHAYEAKDARLNVLNGRLAGATLPTFVWFTDKPNHKTSKLSSLLEKTTRSQQNDTWKESDVEFK